MNRRFSFSNASFQIPYATANDLLLDDSDSLERDFFADEIHDLTFNTPVPNRETTSLQYDYNDQIDLQRPHLRQQPEKFNVQYRNKLHDGRESSVNIREASPTPRASKVVLDFEGSESRSSLTPTPVQRHSTRRSKGRDIINSSSGNPKPQCLPSASTQTAKYDLEPPRTINKSNSKPRKPTRKPSPPQTLGWTRNLTSQEHVHRLPVKRDTTVSRDATTMDVNNYNNNSYIGLLESDRERPREHDPQSSEVTITKVHSRPEPSPERGPRLPEPGSGSKFQIEIEPRDMSDAVTPPIREVNEDLQGKSNEVPISKLSSVIQVGVMEKPEALRLKKSKHISSSSSSHSKPARTEPVSSSKGKGTTRKRTILTVGQKQKSRKTENDPTQVARKRRRLSSVTEESSISESCAEPKPSQGVQMIIESNSSYPRPSDTRLTEGTQDMVASSLRLQQPAKSDALFDCYYPPSVTDTTGLTPPGNLVPKLTQQGDTGEVPDEVQDFLSRYAKKYGSGAANPTSNEVTSRSLSSKQSEGGRAVSALAPLPKRRDVHSETPVAPEIQSVTKSKKRTDVEIETGAEITDTKSSTSVVNETSVDSVRPKQRKSTVMSGRRASVATRDQVTRHDNSTIVYSNLTTMGGVDHYPEQSHFQEFTSSEANMVAVTSSTRLRKDNLGQHDVPIYTHLNEYGVGKDLNIVSKPQPEPYSEVDKPVSAVSESSLYYETLGTNFDEELTFEKKDNQHKRVLETHIISKPFKDEKVVMNPKPLVEPRADDMFARKKRDNYLQKGIDLTAHSSRRITKKSGPKLEQASSRQSHVDPSYVDTQVALKSDSRSVQQKGGKPARVRVRNSNAPDRGLDDRNSEEISRTSAHRKTRRKDEAVAFEVKGDPKPIVGDRNRSGKKTNDKPKPAEPPLSSIGSTIVDQITVLGQKVIETLGLFNSQTQEKQRDYDEAAIGVDTSSKDSVGSLEKEQVAKSQPRSPKSVQTAQSPRKSFHSNLGFAYDDKPSDKDWIDHSDYEHHNEVYSKHESSHRHETRDVPQIPLKRSATMAEVQNRSMEESELLINGRSDDLVSVDRKTKRARISRVSSSRGRSQGPRDGRGQRLKIRDKQSSSVRAKNTGRATNKGVHLSSTGSSQTRKTEDDKKAKKDACGLTIPVAPTFTSDLLRQKRIQSKTERELARSNNEDQNDANKYCSKSDVLVVGGSKASVKALPSNLQPTTKQSTRSNATAQHQKSQLETTGEMAANRRKKDFEEKLKLWEKRASAEFSDLPDHHRPLPNFKGLHAAQKAELENMEKRRKESVRPPTKPIEPRFTVDVRLAERERFDKVRREREKEAERIKGEREREMREREEKEWREARKRSVPRANAVPEWYYTRAQAPKKST
ncbi:hypothetical protein PNOK_0282400 [Pyrrhoderma noxium]|uniref:TPX2 C-terminal domain-containing protein n=1 Tax=Pyrrhoderma noxium TaxID=2282107 RepID=A0A286UTH7_9AGAM|nr:hypothetical protein PNOK_0282400 [Pyrrhoderma noxium]